MSPYSWHLPLPGGLLRPDSFISRRLFLTPCSVRLRAVTDRVARLFVAFVLVVASALIFYSRTYLHYHTPAQVGWGAGLGVALGVLWYVFTQRVLRPMFPAIESWHISRLLLIRVSTLYIQGRRLTATLSSHA